MPTDFTVQRKSLAEEVSSRLQERISSGYFAVGSKLPPEAELGAMFGVGRSSLREAIKVLANAGLLSVRQGSGTYVVSKYATNEPISQRLKRASSSDLDDIRQILEMKIAEKAAQKCNKTDLKNIKKCLRGIELANESKNLESCIDADITFHTAIAAASHNEILLEFYQLASEHLRKWYRKIYKDSEVFATAFDLHERLVRCIEDSDSKAAWALAEQIIKHGRV